MKKLLPPMLSRIAASGFDPYTLHEKTVCVFGLGGLGVIVAEMLVRVGIGKLILVDRDIVGPENLNRLGYTDEDIGLPKVEALSRKLNRLGTIRGENFPLKIEKYHRDVIAWENLPRLIEKCDLIFTCFDNLEARLEINYWSLKLKKPLIDGGTSDDGLRGRVITVIPYKTPCLGCYFDSDTLYSLQNEEEIKSGACTASLPTTMAIVASVQVDRGLRLLLNRGNIIPRININLEDGISIVELHNLKRRRNCKYCGADENE